jgi:hypothetical protein
MWDVWPKTSSVVQSVNHSCDIISGLPQRGSLLSLLLLAEIACKEKIFRYSSVRECGADSEQRPKRFYKARRHGYN